MTSDADAWMAGDDGVLGGYGVRIALVDGLPDLSCPPLRAARVERLVVSWPTEAAVSAHATGCAVLLVGHGQGMPVGCAPGATLVPVPVLGLPLGTRSERDAAIAQGIRAATAAGVDAIVLPFGRVDGSERIAAALGEAAAEGVKLFAAAGNLGPNVVTFPANHPAVVSVTACGKAGILPECPAAADLGAWGEDVDTVGPTGPFRLRGSSPAVVFAAGWWARSVASPWRAVGLR